MAVRTSLLNLEIKLESALYLQASSFVIGRFLKNENPYTKFQGCVITLRLGKLNYYAFYGISDSCFLSVRLSKASSHALEHR